MSEKEIEELAKSLAYHEEIRQWCEANKLTPEQTEAKRPRILAEAQAHSKRAGLTTFVYTTEYTGYEWSRAVDRDCTGEHVQAVFQDGERIA